MLRKTIGNQGQSRASTKSDRPSDPVSLNYCHPSTVMKGLVSAMGGKVTLVATQGSVESCSETGSGDQCPKPHDLGAPIRKRRGSDRRAVLSLRYITSASSWSLDGPVRSSGSPWRCCRVCHPRHSDDRSRLPRPSAFAP